MARIVKWQEEFPKLSIPDDKIDSPNHLLKVGMGKFLRKTTKSDPSRKKCGCLPKMVAVSKGSIGTCLASNFCKRVNLVANQVVTKQFLIVSR